MFEDFLKLIQPYPAPKLEIDDIEKVQYRELDKAGLKIVGMFDKETEEPNGIFRAIQPDGFVQEVTMRNGKAFGLSRLINKDKVEIFVMKDSEPIAFLQFNDKFEELARGGSEE